jgi:acyl-coenzyme A synthetase/AMP-(fatty) acid ligase
MNSPIEHLLFRAKASPNSVAIQLMDKSYTFGEFFYVISACASKLRSLGLKPQQLAINFFKDPLFDLIFTHSAFHEGLISCSSHHGYFSDGSNLEGDWILTDAPTSPSEVTKNQIVIDAKWINDAISNFKINQPIEYGEESVCRLILTSGTTGASKAAVFTYKCLKERVKLVTQHWTSQDESICLMTLSTGVGFWSTLSAISLGNIVYVGSGNAIQLIEKFKIRNLIASPVQIAGLIERSNQLNIRLDFIQAVRVGGGAVTPKLLEKITSQITKKVFNVYGSTEVGGTCMSELTQSHATNLVVGYPFVGVQIEVVNESHETLPFGQEGLVRTKSGAMIDSYYKNTQATAKSFKDGWFYSGDKGYLTADGALVLSGRDSEIINRGGFKVDPVLLDQFFLDYPGIEDVAAFGLENKFGIVDIALALVVPDLFDLNHLQEDALRELGSKSPSVYIKVNKIPRNQMGKVMRMEMGQQFRVLYEKNNTQTPRSEES